jgi:hypothetical protein
MKCRCATLLPLGFGLLAAACGGGGSSPTAANGAPTAPSSLTIAAVAPSLALEINTSLAAALRSGLGIASLERPQTFLAWLANLLEPAPVYAQSGGFLANCRSGGSVRVSSGYSTPGGGRVVFTNSPVSYSSCGFPFGGRTVTMNGTLNAQGTWTAGEPNNPVTLAGSLDVNEIGPVQVTCTSLSTEAGCNGNVGGIRTGPADTPPPPTPTTTTLPAPPCAQFEGNYEGTYSGSLTYMGDSSSVAGNVAFSVSSCVINVSQPGSGSGSVSPSGDASFGGGLTVAGLDGPLSCSFTGSFVPQGGGVGASGSWSCGGAASGSGSWSASRQ